MSRKAQTAEAWKRRCRDSAESFISAVIRLTEGHTGDTDNMRFRLHTKDAKEIARLVQAFKVIICKSIDQARVTDNAPREGLRLIVDNTREVRR
jgi:hypothetical protein